MAVFEPIGPGETVEEEAFSPIGPNETVESDSSPLDVLSQAGIGVTQGLADFSTSLNQLASVASSPVVGAILGTPYSDRISKTMDERARLSREAANDLERMGQQESGPGFVRQLGRAGVGATQLIGPGGLLAGAAKAGLQSYLSTLTDAETAYEGQQIEELKSRGIEATPEELSRIRNESRSKAQLPALGSGLSTLALTLAGGKTGPEALFGITRGKGFQDAAKKLILSTLGETAEEGIDQGVQGFISKLSYDPKKTWPEIFTEALDAAKIGAVLGAGFNAVGQAVTPTAPEADIALPPPPPPPPPSEKPVTPVTPEVVAVLENSAGAGMVRSANAVAGIAEEEAIGPLILPTDQQPAGTPAPTAVTGDVATPPAVDAATTEATTSTGLPTEPQGVTATPGPPLTPTNLIAGPDQSIAKTAKTVDEFIGNDPPVGITQQPFQRSEIVQDIPITTADLKSADPKVEQRWQDARIAKKTIWDQVKQKATAIHNVFTRHFQHLDPKQDGAAIETLRQHEAVPNLSQMKAAQAIRGITAGLGPRKYNVFSRLVILPDIVKDIDRGMFEGKELPFGYTSKEAILTDIERFKLLAARFPDIQSAVNRRQEFIHTLRDELANRGLLHESVKDYDEYFHRQILHYVNMRDSLTPGTSANDVRTHKKGFQKRRLGSSKDFNTSYIQAEFEVVSQALSQIATQDTLSRLKSDSDLKPGLVAMAKSMNEESPGDTPVKWESLIPADYTVWQPVKGNVFYFANSISDKVLEAYLDGLGVITPEDVKRVQAGGGQREQWVIPKRLAKTLDDFRPAKDDVIGKFAAIGINKWKQWTLLNPEKVIRYNVNNLSGDLDIAIAYDPAILKEVPQAAKDLRGYVLKKKAPTAEILDASNRGVLASGFSVQEVPELSEHEFFEVLEGKKPNLIQRYWRTTKDYTQWREDVLRLSAYRYFQKKVATGEPVYAASRKSEVDAISDPKDRAAKLARELIGDYGNISVAGQWMRTHAIPFYSWMEINAPRYVRLFKNIPNEGGSAANTAGRASWVIGKKGAGLAVKAASLYMLISLWNRLFFPDEEEELGDQRGQLHLILGRREDGSIRSLRFQGALSDALSWFGGENLPQDAKEVAEGKSTVGEKLLEAVQAPVNKLVNASHPFLKTGLESATRRSLYPNVFSPRPIRDPLQHAARTLSLATLYNYLADRPTPDGKLMKLVTYATDPGEAAYYAARGLAFDWLDANSKSKSSVIPDKKSNALFYHKQAIKFGDEKLAKKYLDQYMELGGTAKGLKMSVAKDHPLGSIAKKDRKAFFSTLSEKEKAIVLRAEDWFKETYKDRR